MIVTDFCLHWSKREFTVPSSASHDIRIIYLKQSIYIINFKMVHERGDIIILKIRVVYIPK